MSKEHEKTLNALQYAIQMEIDGKEYYRKASEKSTNAMGKDLLKSLSDEEDQHRRKFIEIYDSLREEKKWPRTDFKLDAGKKLRTIFARATRQAADRREEMTSELDDVQGALNMEVKSYDFYQKQSRQASYPGEKEYFEALAGQERQHQLVLLDYYEYLKDPAAYFVEKEHPSLDGG